MAQVEMPKSSIGQKPAEPKKKFQKVVKGKVTVKEQNDIQKIVMEYLVPMVKNGLWSIFNSAISIALWGEDRSRGSSGGYSGSTAQRNSYDRYYSGSQSGRPGNPNPPMRRSLQNIDFECRGDADDILNQMYNALRDYKQVTVGDLWDLMGVSNEPTDYNYGWYMLDQAYIKGIPGGYRLVLPKPVPLH